MLFRRHAVWVIRGSLFGSPLGCAPRYNLAADVCDKHPRDKPAMVWESFDGSYRELVWGELQDLANQAAHARSARDPAWNPCGDRPAAGPETAAIFFGVWKLGAILLSMSVLYRDDSIRRRPTIGASSSSRMR